MNINDDALAGWLYAYLRTPQFRLIAIGERYGHIIKHLEVSHLNALPIIDVDQAIAASFQDRVSRIFSLRDRAHTLIEEGEDRYRRALKIDALPANDTVSFTTNSSSFASSRRRLDAYFYNPTVEHILSAQSREARTVQSLSDLAENIWWPGRFKRVFGDNGTPYVSAEDIFNLNPPIVKRVYAGLVEDREDYFLESNWLVMVRSGQIYGLNGSVRLVGHRLTRFFVSEDLIRISPKGEVIRPGYLLCSLSHPTLGRPLVIRNAYGTSIPHLESADVATVQIPRFEDAVEDQVGAPLEEAVELQAQADEIEDEVTLDAERIVTRFLHGLSTVN